MTLLKDISNMKTSIKHTVGLLYFRYTATTVSLSMKMYVIFHHGQVSRMFTLLRSLRCSWYQADDFGKYCFEVGIKKRFRSLEYESEGQVHILYSNNVISYDM